MSVEELTATAHMCRLRAEQGERGALKEAEKMEAELRNRIGPAPPSQGSPTGLPEPRPWWRFW